MRTKLLKKIHTRYRWYFLNDKMPVLLDIIKKTVVVYDVNHCMEKDGYSMTDLATKVKVSHDEWVLRHLKEDILTRYGYKLFRNTFKEAFNKYKKRINAVKPVGSIDRDELYKKIFYIKADELMYKSVENMTPSEKHEYLVKLLALNILEISLKIPMTMPPLTK
jgi:hypothetical protein